MARGALNGRLCGDLLGSPAGRAIATALLALLIGATAAHAATFSAKTSQHKRVTIDLSRSGKLKSLIVGLAGTCSNGSTRSFWPGFASPFKHPQDASGHVADSYRLTSTDHTFRETARFSAHITAHRVTGTVRGTYTTLASGVVCKSPRVTFSIKR